MLSRKTVLGCLYISLLCLQGCIAINNNVGYSPEQVRQARADKEAKVRIDWKYRNKSIFYTDVIHKL